MKRLTLYIDKWYIIGAVCTDGIPRLISPSNKEDRFWLYFYEDIINDEVVYGKDNQSHYRNKEPHYYGDVFSLITDDSNTFMRYGRKQEFYQIFKASGILQEIIDAIGISEKEKVETYLSFSRDVTDGARLIFMRDVLPGEVFQIKESVARIGHLALEHSIRNGKLLSDGFYLVLNACNENLNYSIYNHKDSLFLRKNEETLKGMGSDLRSRALLENIVNNINKTQHFLRSEEEYEAEYLRLSQYVDDWLVRLENAKPGRPVTITNVSFASLPNTYSTTVLKNTIDERTRSIVDDIIREITTFVKTTGLTNDQINGVVFLGNTFTNEQFVNNIKRYYSLENENYIFYRDKDLPNIIGVYSVIDCSQFKGDTETLVTNGETEIERIRIAKEEEERQREAERIIRIKDDENKKAREAVLRYDEAMDNVFEYEKKQDYAQMKDWAEIALKHKPEDEEAKQKLAESTRLLSDKKVRDEQYKNIIQRAIESLNEKKWQDALSQSEAALTIYSHSAEAKRIHREARKQLDNVAQIDKYLARADLFIAQQLYSEAIEELNKVLSFDAQNKDVEERIKQIEQKKHQQKKDIESLIEKMEYSLNGDDYDKAIEYCVGLQDTDITNQRKWSERLQSIKLQKETFLIQSAQFTEYKKKIEDSDFKEDWASVVKYCTEALRLRADESIKLKMERAKEYLEKERNKEKYKQSINEVKALMTDKKWGEAKDILKELQQNYPGHKDEIRQLFRRVFDAETNTTLRPIKVESEKSRTRNQSYKENNKQVDEDFFGKTTTAKTNVANVQKRKAVNDDFFNIDKHGETQKDDKKVIKKNDFDF